MYHYIIKKSNEQPRKYKIYARGFFRHEELDQKEYDSSSEAYSALINHLDGIGAVIHVED